MLQNFLLKIKQILFNFISPKDAESVYYRLCFNPLIKENEEIISKDPYYSFCYANYILKYRFKLGEDAIGMSVWANHYCHKALRYNHE